MTTTEPLADGLLQDLERLAGFKFSDEAKRAIEITVMVIAQQAISRATMAADLAWQLTQEATAAASRSAAAVPADPPGRETGPFWRPPIDPAGGWNPGDTIQRKEID